MKFDFNNDDIDTIRKSYIIQDTTDPTRINDKMDVEFDIRILRYKIPEKINELRTRINDNKVKNDGEMKIFEEKINKLIDEYYEINEKNREEYLYYWQVLSSYKANEDIISKDLYTKTTKEILDIRLKSLINREKLIISINDKIKELFDS
jgi:hypothetical protein